MMELILQNISYSYNEDTKLFNNVNMDLKFGNIYLLYGGNGCGKSTLSKIISGELKMQHGEIIFPKSLSQESVAYQTQEFQAFPDLKGKEIISFWKNINQNILDDDTQLRTSLEIDKLERKLIKKMSSGEKRALSIYLTCLLNKQIIILDEPFAGLDKSKKEKLCVNLKEYTNNNKLIIMISHEIKGYENLFDYMIELDNDSTIRQEIITV